MSGIVLRCIFMALLLATAANKLRASSEVAGDPLGTIIAALAQQGLAARKHTLPLSNEARESVVFAAPGCGRPIRVLPAALSLHDLPLLEAVVERDYRRWYVYLGQVSPAADRFAWRMMWLKQKAASVLGLAHYSIPKTVLLVAAPPECHAVEQVDWRLVWEQPYRSKPSPAGS
jgi:hypothetical protein